MNTPLRIVYFGTPDFSAVFLTRLMADADLPTQVVAVVTQEDKKVGRKQALTASPVKVVAQTQGVPVYYRWDELERDGIEFDLALVFAYGRILPQKALDLAAHGYWNVHPSLLPQYRGPNPIGAPLFAGDVSTGCTIMLMDSEMDHGPIIEQAQTYIFPQEQREELTGRLVKLGYKLFSQSVEHFVKSGSVETFEQDHANATYTKLLQKDDGYVKLSEIQESLLSGVPVSDAVFNLWRGNYPWPGVWTTVSVTGEPKRLKITQMAIQDGVPSITHVQLAGKNEVTLAQFQEAYSSLLSDPEERTNEKGE